MLPKGVNWLYIDAKEILFNRVTEPKTMNYELGQKDFTVLVTETAYSRNDEIDILTDSEFLNKNIEALKKVFSLDHDLIKDCCLIVKILCIQSKQLVIKKN